MSTADVSTAASGPADPAGVARRALDRLRRSLGASGRELACLGSIFVLAAVLRLVSLSARGGWDSDQGTEMLALRSALASGHLPTFGPEAISVTSSFHHGALYYDLLLPAAWLGGGDPTWVVAEIALLSLIVVPIVWWIARGIAGPAAGLTAALLAAASASLIGYATFIWNPTLVEPGAAVAFLGAWQAQRAHRPAWWLVSAAGAAVAVQAHIAASVIVLPLALTFGLDLWRGPAGKRIRICSWGLAGVGLFAATYLPFIVSELGHDFSDTRGMLAYFSDPNSTTSVDPWLRLVFATIRILAWPLTRWPMVDRQAAVVVALVTATAIIMGLVWRLGVTGKRSAEPTDAGPGGSAAAGAVSGPIVSAPTLEGFGVRLIFAWLLLIILALGFGLHAVSEVQVQELPTEQYHVVADPLIFVTVGLITAGLWRPLSRSLWTVVRRLSAVVAIAALLVWNVGHWPPLTAPDGGWPAGQAAATRLERDAAGSPMALVPLFEAKGGDAYLYPLLRDGLTLVAPEKAATVVLLCDSYWLTGCGGSSETNWLASNPAGRGLVLVESFTAAPYRILTVYRRAP